MVQSYDFDKYRWNPPVLPSSTKHKCWDWAGYDEFDECAEFDVDGSDEAPDDDSDYEQYRRERMAQNAAKLQELFGSGEGGQGGGPQGKLGMAVSRHRHQARHLRGLGKGASAKCPRRHHRQGHQKGVAAGESDRALNFQVLMDRDKLGIAMKAGTPACGMMGTYMRARWYALCQRSHARVKPHLTFKCNRT